MCDQQGSWKEKDAVNHCFKRVTLQTGYDTTQSQSKSKVLKMEGLFRDLAFLQKFRNLKINTCCKTYYFNMYLFIMKGKYWQIIYKKVWTGTRSLSIQALALVLGP